MKLSLFWHNMDMYKSLPAMHKLFFIMFGSFSFRMTEYLSAVFAII